MTTYNPEHADTWNKHRHKQSAPLVLYIDYAAHEAAGWGKHRHRHAAKIVVPVPEREEVPVKLQLLAWAKAIIILDASEVLIRDLIERELYGRTGTTTGPTALLIARQLAVKVGEIRQEAIKTAFRALRDWLGDVPILEISLSRWAESFAVKDAKGIDMAIQTGLIAGLDNTEIARKVVGSMGLNGVDGVTEFTRHKIAHLGRAAIKESALRKKDTNP